MRELFFEPGAFAAFCEGFAAEMTLQHVGVSCLQQPQNVQCVFVVESTLFSFGHPFRDFV